MVHRYRAARRPRPGPARSGAGALLEEARTVGAIFQVLVTVATVLGIWTAASLLATPVFVIAFRSTARVNARFDRDARRSAWLSASNEA